jgi:CRISPR/Cas system-associated exonuclease Cas4 (RecB family)
VIDHLSHSSVQTFQACPRKWTYKQAGVAAERTPVTLAFGIAVHDGAATKNELAFTGTPLNDQDQQAFTASWNVATSNPTAPLHLGSATVDDLTATGRKLIDLYVPPPRIVGVEQPVVIRLADDLPPIHGRIDLIHQDDHGDLIIADLKTSCSKALSDTAPVEAQLTLYAEAYASARLEAIVLAKLKTPVVTVQPIMPWPRDRLVTMYRETYAAMRAGVRFAVRSSTMCQSCPYRDRCEQDG